MLARMNLVFPVLMVGLGACVIWLLVRFVNRRERWAAWLAVALLVGLSYPGAYLALLAGKVYWLIGVDAASQQNLYVTSPRYRLSGPVVKSLFAPVHWVDRRVRSEYWNTIENTRGRKWKNPP
ncbi:MAG: hypothetical protein JSS02_11480 [Planctomycetes bacterium]|nr:hypothetical protein [Planctomycetota bacterium]